MTSFEYLKQANSTMLWCSSFAVCGLVINYGTWECIAKRIMTTAWTSDTLPLQPVSVCQLLAQPLENAFTYIYFRTTISRTI
jgi:hypothetical protein